MRFLQTVIPNCYTCKFVNFFSKRADKVNSVAYSPFLQYFQLMKTVILLYKTVILANMYHLVYTRSIK